MQALDGIIVAAFVVYAVAAGLRSRRVASRGLEEYFLAGRSLSGWQAGISMAATQFAADTPLLVTGLVATAGIFALWRLWIYAIAFLALGFLLSPSWRKARVLTDAELCELRYGGRPASVLRAVKAVYFGLIFNCTVLAMVMWAAKEIAQPFLLWHEWQANPDAGVIGGNVGLGIVLAIVGILAASVANVIQANPTGRGVPMVSLLAWAMLYGTLFDLGFAWITAGPPPVPAGAAYWGGIVYLALVGSVVTFPLHYSLVREIGAGKTAYNAIVTVAVAMLLSTLFEDYQWTALAAGGMALALLGMVIALRSRKIKSVKVGQATTLRHEMD